MKFLQNIINLRNAKKEYSDVIKKLINERKINNSLKLEMDSVIKKYNLEKKDIRKIKSRAFKEIFEGAIEDHKITASEKKDLEEIIDYFDMSPQELGMDQNVYNKYYILGQIEEGVIPVVDSHNLNIVFKKDEVLHWAENGKILKTRRVAERVVYSGPRASIKIMKGLSYRAGSYKFKTYSREVTEIVDTGAFWITNLRVGYIGYNKNFTCNLDRIHSVLIDDGLKIFKEGRQNPFQAWLNDYEVSLAILSKLLNKEG